MRIDEKRLRLCKHRLNLLENVTNARTDLWAMLRSSTLMAAAVVAVSVGTPFERAESQLVVTKSIQDGDWNDPAIWSRGVPTNSSRAIVGEDTTVNLGGRDHVAGELIIHGILNVPEGVAETDQVRTDTIEFSRDGIAVSDSATGQGHLMYSVEDVQSRFGVGNDTNSNVIAVRFANGGWQFNNDIRWRDFLPESGDRLIAEVDFDSNTVTALRGVSGRFRGIAAGYVIGNLTFESNPIGLAVNALDIFVGGDWFTSATRRAFRGRSIGSPGQGVAVAIDVSGEGYLMHSVKSTQSRFGMSAERNGNVIAVRNVGLGWEYNNGRRWIGFDNRASDRILAAVDFSDDRVTSLRGSTGEIEGIQAGFLSGDISFESNGRGRAATGRGFVVHGTQFVTNRFIRPTSNELDVDKTLTTRFVHVNSRGVFRIGSDHNRFDDGTFTMTLTGIQPLSDHTIPMANGTSFVREDYDGFLIAEKGGRLQFFGEDRLGHTQLSATAKAGDASIRVVNVIERNFDGVTSEDSDGRVDFKVGDEIVIASSSNDYREEDVRTVVSVDQNRFESILGLDRPLSYRHYGEIETYGQSRARGANPTAAATSINLRAEVALLSRNVVITGLESQDTDVEFGDRILLQSSGRGRRTTATNGIGGHIIIFGGAGQTGIDGVQLDLMGQAGLSGRYPIHWYLGGDREGDFFRNSSVTNSNNRGVVVHGTDNLTVEEVVIHDIHGHGFFTQSGVEMGNRFYNNIAFGIHRVGTSVDLADPFIVDVHDLTRNQPRQFVSSSAFWITSAANAYMGNISAGAEGSGFWFAPVGEAERPPTAADFIKGPPELVDIYNRDPLALTIGQFEHNTSHSAATGLVIREIVQTGFQGSGDLADKLFGGDESVLGDVGLIKDFTVYKTFTGFYSRTDEAFVHFENFRAADNQFSYWDTMPATIDKGLFVGHSRGNSQSYINANPIAFFRYFDQLRLSDIHFAGYGVNQHGVTPTLFRNGGFQNQVGSTATGISFEDTATAESVRHIEGALAVAGLRPLLDLDGSLTGHVGGGAGYNLLRAHDYWFTGQDDDEVISSSAVPNEAAITRKEFASFHLIERGEGGAGQNVRLRITPPHGESFEFGGVPSDEVANSVGRRPFVDDPRAPVVVGEEYTIEPVRPYNLPINAFKFAYFDWKSPENTVSNTFRLVGAAEVMTPTYSQTGKTLRRVGRLARLRAATENTFFRDSNGDLYLKLFNATADTPGAIDRNIFTMVPF